MPKRCFKYCIVLKCSNTTGNAPEKYFHTVPQDEKRRELWMKMCRRKHILSPKSTVCVCEDHFDYKKDLENYYEWSLNQARPRLKKYAVPSKFVCQEIGLPRTGRETALRRRKKENLNELVQVHRGPGKIEKNLLEESYSMVDCNTSGPKKKTQRRRKGRKRGRKKQLKTEDDEVIKYIESLEARKRLNRCVLCSRPLLWNKEYLSTLTSTTGLSLQQCLIGISNGRSTNIKDCSSSEMVCFYCAHLINYADALEAELVKLKNAICGCLEIQNMNEVDQEMLKPEFDSHIAILDEYSERVVGPGSAAERESLLNENLSNHNINTCNRNNDTVTVQPHPLVHDDCQKLSESSPDPLVHQGNGEEIDVKNVTCIPGDQEPRLLKEDGVSIESEETSTSSEAEFWESQIVEKEKSLIPKESCPPKIDPPDFECKICHLRTSSRSVLLFHLRRHMAHYQWCDFCDYTIFDEDEGEQTSKGAPI